MRVRQAVRLRDIDVGQVVIIPVGVLEVVVRCLVVVHEKERFVVIPTLLEPVQGLVGHGIGRVHAGELDQILGPWFLGGCTVLGSGTAPIELLAYIGYNLICVCK